MVYIYDGKQFAKTKEDELKIRVEKLSRLGIKPKLAIILAGNDPSSILYISLKKKAAERIGIEVLLLQLSEVSKNAIVNLIDQLNNDTSITGILLQLPLPGNLDNKELTKAIVKTIDLKKDVDGLRADSLFTSATTKAVLYAITEAQVKKFLPIDLSTISICVVGGTGIVGSSIISELSRMLATKGLAFCGYIPSNIEIVNSKTLDVGSFTIKADLLISCAGVPNIIKKDIVKPGVVIIDIGSPKGDVAENVWEVASFITPVPGGIGPMTVICLLENTIEAVEKF